MNAISSSNVTSSAASPLTSAASTVADNDVSSARSVDSATGSGAIASGSISMLGVGSGLDLNSMLDKLATAGKASLTPLTMQQQSWSAKLSGYGQFKTALEQFQSANKIVADSSLFTATHAVTSSEAFTASTSAGAVAGQSTVNVSQLARAQVLTTGISADIDAPLGKNISDNRILTISMVNGQQQEISLNDSQTSVSGLRDTINHADIGVTASVIKVSDDSFRLSLTASETGTAGAISSLKVDGDDELNNFISFGASGAALSETVKPQNAKLTVNNIEVESGTNTVSDALSGVTLDLNGISAGDQTLTVTADNARAEQAVSDWIDSYNSLMDTSASLAKYAGVGDSDTNSSSSSSDESSGPLTGDSTLRDTMRKLQSALQGHSGSQKLQALVQVGVTTDPTSGKLLLDGDQFHAALAESAEDVSALFAGDVKSSSGIASSVSLKLNSILSADGQLQNAENAVSNRLSTLQQRYNVQSQRIENNIERYKKQFTELDSALSRLNSTSAYLSQQFSGTSTTGSN